MENGAALESSKSLQFDYPTTSEKQKNKIQYISKINRAKKY